MCKESFVLKMFSLKVDKSLSIGRQIKFAKFRLYIDK